MSSLKTLAKGLTPPLLLAAYRSVSVHAIQYRGPYRDWESARREASGYADDAILQRVREAALKVRDGRAAYERDSVAFDRIDYPFPLLAALLRTAVLNNGALRVLDFGGSLGSSYFHCRGFLEGLKELRWCVVEQQQFVACGNKEFANHELSFFPTIGECIAREAPVAALLSSVLPYVPEPYAILGEITRAAVATIIIDRTHYHDGSDDLVFLQRVPPEIYPASYPCRVFSRLNLEAALRDRYELTTRFEAIDDPIRAGGTEIRFGGWIWTRKVAA